MAGIGLTMTISGSQALQDLVSRLSGPALDEAIVRGLKAGGLVFQSAAQGYAPVRSGNLRSSIHLEQTGAREVTVGTDIVYARIQEFGGVVTPKRAKMLHFVVDGQDVFAHSVTIPAHPYMRPAYDTRSGAALDAVQAAIRAQLAGLL